MSGRVRITSTQVQPRNRTATRPDVPFFGLGEGRPHRTCTRIPLQFSLDAAAESLHRNFVLEALAVASNGGHGQRLSGSLK